MLQYQVPCKERHHPAPVVPFQGWSTNTCSRTQIQTILVVLLGSMEQRLSCLLATAGKIPHNTSHGRRFFDSDDSPTEEYVPSGITVVSRSRVFLTGRMRECLGLAPRPLLYTTTRACVVCFLLYTCLSASHAEQDRTRAPHEDLAM
jgi:hypothetical protein